MSFNPLPSTGFKPRHTGGPWSLGTTQNSARITDQEKRFICCIEGLDLMRPEDQANARLVADAPTLLYELRNLIDAITHAEQTHDMQDLLQYRDLALKKVSKHLQPSKTPV